MNKLILKITLFSAVLFLTLTSCETGPTVQSYYVDSQEKDGFVTSTIPKSLLGVDEKSLSPESKEAYESVKKVNVLFLPATEDKKEMVVQETQLFASILEDSDYKTLMRHNSDGIKVQLVYDGSSDSIDEIIVFGSSEEMGMGVARVLGDDMNLGNIMKMTQELDISKMNPGNLKGVLGGIGVDIDKQVENTSDKNKTSEKVTDTVQNI